MMNIEKLMSQMTLEEKIGQLLQCGTSIYKDYEEIKWDMVRTGRIGAFLYIRDAEVANEIQRVAVEESRLGIPVIFGDDIIHGFYTIFPVPASEACSWEPELARKTAEVSARETRANGVQWTFAPMVDVARDARWGRNVEGAGEDPFLASQFAAARVKGFQGDDISAMDRVAACAKHFAGYGSCMGGRDYNSVEMSLQTLHDIHLPAFQAAIDADVATVMTAYHDLNGVPCTGNKYLLTDVLRDEMGFEGMLVSDARAVEELIYHGFAEDEREAAQKAMDAGVDLEMSSFAYSNHMKALIEEGIISMERLNEAVRRVLTLKDQLGLFENPYINMEEASKVRATEESIALARESSRKSIVLLKNDKKILPLDKKAKIAVIGSLAGSEEDMNGAWSGRTKTATTIYAAFKSGGYDIRYAKGYDLKQNEVYIDEAIAATESCDVIFFVAGEGNDKQGTMSGEAKNRCNIEIPKIQQTLLAELKKTGKPIVAYIFSGRPLALPEVHDCVDAMLWSGGLGTEAGNAIMDVVFGDYNPSAKLVWTFPNASGQSPTFYNRNNTGKPPQEDIWYSSKYIDAPIKPMYPFGYGLSYTEYKYEHLVISDKEVGLDGTLDICVDVTNTGERMGEEIVQLYVRDKVGSMARPIRELKGFKKIMLLPQETKTVKFSLKISDIGFHNQQMQYVVEPGKFGLYVGPDSDSGLETEFVVKQ